MKSYSESNKIYYQVIDYVAREIQNGNFKKGEKIPTERNLVKTLNISRNSIREALKILELTGVLKRKQGDGTYINKNYNNFFSEPMTIAFMLTDNNSKDIFEFRYIIEKEIARLASERIEGKEIINLEKTYRKMLNSKNENSRSINDSKFHFELVKITKNLILINIYNAMKAILNLFIEDIRRKALVNVTIDEIEDAHKEIFYAVINKETKKAVKSMENHMMIIKNNYNQGEFSFNYNLNKANHVVLKYMIEEIREGNLKKGDKIASERELQKKLNISRNSIREIYKILSALGILEFRHNNGTYIRKELTTWSKEPMQLIFKLSGITEEDIFEFRKIIETEVAYLAAQRITDVEIKELKMYYNIMQTSKDEIEKAKMDKKFHYVIAKATKNSIIMNTYNAISPMLDLFTYNIRKEVEESEPEGILETLHENIFNGIINRDKEMSKKSMKAHMDMIIRYFKTKNNNMNVG